MSFCQLHRTVMHACCEAEKTDTCECEAIASVWLNLQLIAIVC